MDRQTRFDFVTAIDLSAKSFSVRNPEDVTSADAFIVTADGYIDELKEDLGRLEAARSVVIRKRSEYFGKLKLPTTKLERLEDL